jgi:hypothetical protein
MCGRNGLGGSFPFVAMVEVDPGDAKQLFAAPTSDGDIFYCLLKEILVGEGVNDNFLATTASSFRSIYKIK